MLINQSINQSINPTMIPMSIPHTKKMWEILPGSLKHCI